MPENEFDTTADEASLKALEDEIKQAEASLESDFSDFAASKIDEKLEELFFEDKKAFIQQILTFQNEFLNTHKEKITKANELKNTIGQKKAFGSIQQAQDAFLQKHPEVDMNILMSFYQDELNARQKKELDNLSPEAFFETLFSMYQGQNEPKKQNTDEKPPLHLEGATADENVPVTNAGFSTRF